MVKYIDCLTIANKIKAEIAEELNGVSPLLSIVGFDGNPNDALYLRGIEKDAKELGIRVEMGFSPDSNGVLPFTYQLDKRHENMDVDGVFDGSPFNRAVTEAVNLIVDENGGASGKVVTVIGRNLGASIAGSMLAKDATVTICHSKTGRETLPHVLEPADIVICATSGARFSSSILSANTMLIDIGNGFTILDTDEVAPRELLVTPRKNGVGVITRAVLLSRVAFNFLNGITKG